jgi:ribosomal-protein-alanine N-acetyltransferase
LGYWVATIAQGQGHATRAVALALEVMRTALGMYSVEAHTQVDNVASQQVLKRNGFTPFGVSSEHIFIDGAWRDDIFWQRKLRDGPLPAPE